MLEGTDYGYCPDCSKEQLFEAVPAPGGPGVACTACGAAFFAGPPEPAAFPGCLAVPGHAAPATAG